MEEAMRHEVVYNEGRRTHALQPWKGHTCGVVNMT